MYRVVFLLAPGLHLLDLAGPAQVFSELGSLGLPYDMHYVADRPEILTAQGLPVRASVEWPAPDPQDLLFVPGWRASGPGGGWPPFGGRAGSAR